MRWRDRIIVGVGLLGGLVLLFTASGLMGGIHQAREEMGLVVNAPLENAPPSLAFATVAMGAFRGLVVDVLWMRADRLKEEGLFFDARQLADWITILQPRFAAVWDFQAWNMAYNISVAVPAEQWEERWRWVRNGIEILRDRGIPTNPKSILLYRSLAWIFQHKMGDVADDCHRHYKRELALDMRRLLGNPETNETFERLAAAPKDLETVLADPQAAEFVQALRSADPLLDQKDPLELARKYLGLRAEPRRFRPEAFAVIDKYRGTNGLEAFDVFARATVLRQEWKYEIPFMQEMNRRYGRVSIDDPNDRQPLNWEHPDAHAIYWAELGLKRAGNPDRYSIDEKNTDRIVFHSLQSLYRTGDVVIYPTGQGPATVLTLPDLQMFDSCNEAWKNRIEKYESFEGGNPKAVRGGHRNFLENAVHSFYRAGYRRKAARIYAQLRREFSEGEHRKDFSMPLVEYVRARIRHEQESSIGDKDATEQVLLSLRTAFFYYAIRKDDTAAGYERWAEEVYQVYQKRGQEEPGRVGLPPLAFIKYQAFRQFMEDRFFPEELRRNLLSRIQIERPDLYKQIEEQRRKEAEQAPGGVSGAVR